MKAVTIGETCVATASVLLSWFLVNVDCGEWIILQWAVTLGVFGCVVLSKALGKPG